MNLFKLCIKLIASIIFVIISFSSVQAKNLNKFNEGNNISNYFSGLLLFNNNQYKESYKFLKKLDGLEKSHSNYSLKYLISLINSGKFNEAFNYSKKLEKKNLDSFESDLIIGIYYFKNQNYNLSKKYFSKIKNKNSKFILNNFISESFLNWSNFDKLDLNEAQIKINKMDKRFENIKKIQYVFLHCFYKSRKTESLFKKLISDDKVDFSRYNYFYAKYLENEGKINEAEEVINSSLKLHPRNLLLTQYQHDLRNGKVDNNFSCSRQSDALAEILYIAANALSSQSIYNFSNFYLNLAKYLNNNFYSYNALLAENFYKVENLSEAEKIYNKLGKEGKAFLWYAAKQNAKIYNKLNKKEKALKIINRTYEKLSQKNIYETFDYADFLKDNNQFEDSIKFYTKVINSINKNHPLFPEATEGRGIAYERIGVWDKAEKDLLSSLDVNPDQAYVINYLAYSWIEQGVKINQSLKMLEKANALKINDPYIVDSLGWALFKLKRYKDAKNYLQTAVQLMPADPTVNDHYGDVLWKNGDKIQARYFWNYALSLEEVKDDLIDSIQNKLISGL